MNTAKAVIDVHSGRLTLQGEGEKEIFDVYDDMSYPTYPEACFQLDEEIDVVVITPWYTDMVNYLVTDRLPPDLSHQQRQKIKHDARYYQWEDPILYKSCSDGIFRRCIPDDEIQDVLHHFHAREVGGHFGSSKTAAKVLQCGFFWPTLFKDAHEHVKKCDAC